MSLHLKDFEIVLNKDCPHIKIEYRYDDIYKHIRYCIYLFDEGLIGLHHFYFNNGIYEEFDSEIYNNINDAIKSINYKKAA